jgi:antigen flippase
LQPISTGDPISTVTQSEGHSYRQILKSSALIGFASLLDIGFRVVRVKAMALWLGPAGVGLMGLYSSVADLTQSLAGMGVESSGVRQIAQAVGSQTPDRIALTVHLLRRACFVLGLAGAVLLAAFSGPVSTLTFGSDDHAGLVALLSLAVLFRLIYAGQAAALRGMRRIADLARMDIVAGFFATAITIPLIYFLREDGVVPSLVAAAAVMVCAAWWFSRKLELRAPAMSGADVRREGSALLKLGFAFMVTGLMTMGAAYAIRVIVLHTLGIDAAGLYQSAWTIGGLYVGFILQAMGTDFYPRLTAVSDDSSASNRLVNEQVLVSLLLAGPGVLATLTLTPVLIALFYTARFDDAIGPLRWICLGMSLRVITWPLGFIVVAKGLQGLFIWIDLACTIVHLGLAWFLVRTIGLDGAGMAFFGLYVFHAAIIYPIARRITGFRWSSANKRIALVYVPLIALVFAAFYVLPSTWSTAFGVLAVLTSSAGSAHMLVSLLPAENLPTPLRRVMDRVRRLVPR